MKVRQDMKKYEFKFTKETLNPMSGILESNKKSPLK